MNTIEDLTHEAELIEDLDELEWDAVPTVRVFNPAKTLEMDFFEILRNCTQDQRAVLQGFFSQATV
jgi:hypothetical protein